MFILIYFILILFISYDWTKLRDSYKIVGLGSDWLNPVQDGVKLEVDQMAERLKY